MTPFSANEGARISIITWVIILITTKCVCECLCASKNPPKRYERCDLRTQYTKVKYILENLHWLQILLTHLRGKYRCLWVKRTLLKDDQEYWKTITVVPACNFVIMKTSKTCFDFHLQSKLIMKNESVRFKLSCLESAHIPQLLYACLINEQHWKTLKS